MYRKIIVALLTAFILSVGVAYAEQIDGLMSGNVTPAVPDPGGDPLNMYVNPGGLGQTLLYGYYNVRDNKVFYFNVVNTSSVGVVTKVRFREAADIKDAVSAGVDSGSIEVLDFNLCLSRNDVFTGAIVSDSSTGAARLVSLDTDSPTNPTIPSGGVVFKFGSSNPVAGITADNTREGYMEILSFEEWDDTKTNCTSGFIATTAPNGLMGIAMINDEDTNATYAYKAVPLANFTRTPVAPSLATDTYNLGSSSWLGFIGVDYVLIKSHIMGTYLINPDLDANTNFVVTFPTKLLNLLAQTTLFDDPTVSVHVFDDQENTITPSTDFSPFTVKTNQLPFEVNVLQITNAAGNGAAIFTSDVEGKIDVGSFIYGYIDINLEGNDAAAISCADGVSDMTLFGAQTCGLPALPYVMIDAIGADISFELPMSYTTNIINPVIL